MSGNSSSSEDDKGRIKEAIDVDFLTKNLYVDDKLIENCRRITKPISSLRNQNQQEFSHNPFSIKVTPEFQKHVSKQLSKLLDEIIDDIEIIQKQKKSEVKSNSNLGVKLLSSSKNCLVSNSDFKTSMNKRKLKKKGLSEREYKGRAKEVAVTPEWVLSQEETRYWTSNKKEIIEIVKLEGDYSNLSSQKEIKI